MIATDAGKVIIPPHTAAIVMIPRAPLDDISAEKTAQSKPNHHNERCANDSISKLALSASTLSFIIPMPTKNNPNQIISFAYRSRFSFLINIRMSAPHAMSGYAKDPISNSLNQISAANSGSMGDQMFAPRMTPIAFWSCMIPAPVNARTRSDTSVLLWRTVVVHAPVQMAFRAVLVWFWRSCLSFFPQR